MSRIGNVTAGLIALAVAVAVVYVSFIGIPFRGDYEIHAVFAQASEIHERTPVRIAGVEVGKVKHVERGDGTSAVVTMKLADEALPLHRDATAKIRPRIFLEGNFFLDLRPGTPSAPKLEEGGTIPLGQTATPVQLDQVLADLQQNTRENLEDLLEAYAAALDRGGARAIAGGARVADEAFTGAAQASEASRGEREGDLGGFVDDAGRTSAALARDERALAELVTGLNRTLRGLAGTRDGALARSVRELDGLVAEAGPAFDASNAAFPPLRRFIRELRPALREAPATLRLAIPAVDQAGALLRPPELPALRRELDASLRSLSELEPRLVELFPLVTPVTECLRRNAVPTLKKSVVDPPLTTGQPVYRELLYGTVGLASSSQNFDGNGPAVRYHAGFGDQVVTTGRAPSAGEPLVGLTSEPIIGSRPRYPAQVPPFRPDVPCTSQEPPDLRAETGPAPAQRSLSAGQGARR